MAIACLVDRAPCLPPRTWWNSSRTNSPACADGDFPCRLSRRARSMVLRSGISASFSALETIDRATRKAHALAGLVPPGRAVIAAQRGALRGHATLTLGAVIVACVMPLTTCGG